MRVEGNVVKGPSMVPFWVATGSRTRSPLPLSNFLLLLLAFWFKLGWLGGLVGGKSTLTTQLWTSTQFYPNWTEIGRIIT